MDYLLKHIYSIIYSLGFDIFFQNFLLRAFSSTKVPNNNSGIPVPVCDRVRKSDITKRKENNANQSYPNKFDEIKPTNP